MSTPVWVDRSPCPGGCGTITPPGDVACQPCYAQVPPPRRVAVARAVPGSRDELRALYGVHQWLQDESDRRVRQADVRAQRRLPSAAERLRAVVLGRRP